MFWLSIFSQYILFAILLSLLNTPLLLGWSTNYSPILMQPVHILKEYVASLTTSVLKILDNFNPFHTLMV